GALFASNFALLREGGGYFAEGAEMKPLLHLWSLGIEEQFYFVWPLMLVLLHRSRRVVPGLAVVALASFALNMMLIGRDPRATFYWPFTRFWELVVGALLAQLMRGGTMQSIVDWGPLAIHPGLRRRLPL